MAELAIVAVRSIYRAHTAGTQDFVALIGAESRQSRLVHRRERGAPPTKTGEERFNFCLQRGISGAGRIEISRALIQRRVEQILNLTITARLSFASLSLAWLNLTWLRHDVPLGMAGIWGVLLAGLCS